MTAFLLACVVIFLFIVSSQLAYVASRQDEIIKALVAATSSLQAMHTALAAHRDLHESIEERLNRMPEMVAKRILTPVAFLQSKGVQ